MEDFEFFFDFCVHNFFLFLGVYDYVFNKNYTDFRESQVDYLLFVIKKQPEPKKEAESTLRFASFYEFSFISPLQDAL